MSAVTKGYKCNYCCLGFFEDKEKALSHAEKCDFNPENKRCFTCDSLIDIGYDYSIPACELKVANFHDMQDDGLDCVHWKRTTTAEEGNSNEQSADAGRSEG